MLWFVLVAVAVLVTGCGPAGREAGTTPTPATGQILSVEDIAGDPQKYVGQQLVVEGVLKAEGAMPNARFYLVGRRDERL